MKAIELSLWLRAAAEASFGRVARVGLLGIAAPAALAGASAVENSEPVRSLAMLPLGGDVKPLLRHSW